MSPKIFISTVPFGEIDSKPLKLLEQTGWEFIVNPLNRKLTSSEVAEMASTCDGIIAGTEDLRLLLEKNQRLKIISRVGIGLDSVPLFECRNRNIAVSYTPDAVTMAVAEITLGVMIGLTRHVYIADSMIRNGEWNRMAGKRIEKSVIGIIGFGRTGSNLARLLVPFRPKELLINDIKDKSSVVEKLKNEGLNIRFVDKSEIYKRSDIISLHVPYYDKTKNMINADTFDHLKKECFLLNYSRGGIINEKDLYIAMKNNKIAGAAIDAFETEPYNGELIKLKNILLTQHMGSCSYDCRSRMEIEATEELIRFFKGEKLINKVPDEEYLYQLKP